MGKMRIDKKVKRYIDKNGTVIKNYPTMCEILGEEKTSGEGKKAQLDRWKIYFDFENQGQKFIINEVYDEEVVKEQEKEYEKNKMMKNLFHGKYRKHLVPILLYLLKKENEILENTLVFAQQCGFFNMQIGGKREYKEYIEFQEKMKNTRPNKKYYDFPMSERLLNFYYRDLTKSAYDDIESALESLQKCGIIKYRKVYVGVSKSGKVILSKKKEEEYKNLREQAKAFVLAKYNETAVKKKEVITDGDLACDTTLFKLVYKKLGELVNDKMYFSKVSRYYSIKLIKESEAMFGFTQLLDDIRCVEFCTDLNEKFVENLNFNAFEKLKDHKNIYMNEKINMYVGSYLVDKWYKLMKNEYYNKTEILDLLVSIDGSVDIMDIDKVECIKEIPDEKIKKIIDKIMSDLRYNKLL